MRIKAYERFGLVVDRQLQLNMCAHAMHIPLLDQQWSPTPCIVQDQHAARHR